MCETQLQRAHTTYLGKEIARFDEHRGGGIIEFDGVASLVVVEAQCGACAAVELGLCYETDDDHASAQHRRLLHLRNSVTTSMCPFS
jgi:hypothetical protein